MAKVFMITEGLENMGALRTGGQGSVYKGRRIGEIITAVKLLPTPIYSESKKDKNYRDFQNEVEKLKKVNEEPNPNVVKILNSGITESGSFPFIEMEFIEGPDLEELLKPPHEPVFTLREAIRVADQLSHALAHCHRVGVKHGDIKSNNVKLNVHTGNYVLLDFGLAIMSDEQRRTSLRHAGAIEFMAPEQNDGKMLFQTDIYSFGVVLFELLAGIVPFPLADNGETSRNNVMVSHMETPVPDILQLRRDHLPAWPEGKRQLEMQVPKWFLDVIAKCLKKDPDDRYSTGLELHDAIINHNISDLKENENNTEGAAVLHNENKKLRSQILQYRAAAETSKKKGIKYAGPGGLAEDNIFWDKKTTIRVSRPAFLTLLLVIACLGVLAGYTYFSRDHDSNYTIIEGLDTTGADTSAVANLIPVKESNLNIPREKVEKNDNQGSSGSVAKDPEPKSTENPPMVTEKRNRNKNAAKKGSGRNKNNKSKRDKFIDIRIIKPQG